ncbi:hypothetical protein [Candidatus Spongiihabitans sp.]|uniref:hypothetical protein n=1 Tax=Candidatus Spongiihabitans sp. TaxID=3101308 RepID=UPI003C7BC0F7
MPTAREGGSANNAGAIICRPLGKAEVSTPYGTSIDHAIRGNIAGSKNLPKP